MKVDIFFFALFLAVSCHNKDGQSELMAFENKYKATELSCREQESLLLSVLKENHSDFEFITDESKVLEILKKFDIELTGQERRLSHTELVYKYCKNDQKTFPFSCPSGEVLVYLRSLIEGARRGQWSAATKTAAIDTVTKYIRFQNTQRHDLLSIYSLMGVYEMLSSNKFLNADLTKEIETNLLELRALQKAKRKTASDDCHQLTEDFKTELEVAKGFHRKTIDWEDALPTGP